MEVLRGRVSSNFVEGEALCEPKLTHSKEIGVAESAMQQRVRRRNDFSPLQMSLCLNCSHK